LVLDALAVLERQVHELALHGQQLLLSAVLYHMARRLERQRVAGKGARRAARHVARKLVEHQDAREARAPGLEPSSIGRERFVQLEKPPRYFGVERRVLLEPALLPLAVLGPFAEPERENL